MTIKAPAVWTMFDGRPLLPTHTPVGGADFMPAGWCGGCGWCGPAPDVCLACSYDSDGHPAEGVLWERCRAR